MNKTVKPFRVNAEWLDYAHGPGAEDGQPLATRLMESPGKGSSAELTDPELVAEVVSVAELYTSDSSVQHDDRIWFRGYPKQVIKRGNAWLKEQASA